MSDRDIKRGATVPALELLESRTLYSADIAGSLVGFAIAPEEESLQLSLTNPNWVDRDIVTRDGHASEQHSDFHSVLAADLSPNGGSLELIFVDAAVRDYELLISSIRSNAEPQKNYLIQVIETGADGIELVSDRLSQYQQQIDAIHIISHGADAVVHLGAASINAQSTIDRAAELTAWGSALKPYGDIAIYGCNLASSVEGESVLNTLGSLTGADVAASTNLTGHSSFNADWDLEYRAGEVEADTLFSDDGEADWNALLAVINVSTTADVVDASAANLNSVAGLISNPGPDGEISLREAIIASEADAGADEIQLASQTYTLSLAGSGDNGDLDISDDLTIRGAGPAVTKIDASGIDRTMEISAGTVQIEGVTLTGGESPNAKSGGGVLLTGGTLTLNDVVLSDNSSTGATGGGLYADSGSSLFIYDSVFRNNMADPDGAPNYKDGGALYVLGDATLERVTFQNNKGDRGGAIHNHGSLQMTDVWFMNNTASSSGGAIDNHGGTSFIMDRVTFESNTSSAEGGALKTDGPTTIRNVTFSGNVSSMGGGAVDIDGGSTVVEIENSTFVGNTASTDGGAISNASNNVTLKNSIFSGNTATAAGTNDFDGSVTSLGYNLVEDPVFPDAIDTDIVGEDAKPGPLQDNGGYVKTHGLLFGSPAINAGGGPAREDATGVPHDVMPDIGAYESRDAHTIAKVYWTDFTDKVIYRANEDGTGIQSIVSATETPFDIEIDTVNDRIYWVEASGNYFFGGDLGSLYSADLDGSNKTQLLSGLKFPTGIALDNANGHVYLTLDTTTTNTTAAPYVNEIVRYDLDGSNPLTIADGEYTESSPDRIRSPTDIEYDPASQRLYWSDRGEFANVSDADDEIKLIDLSAGVSQIQVIGQPAETGHSPLGLTVLPGGTEIYWANTKGISHIVYDSALQSENDSAVLSSSLVVGVQYHPQNGKIYLSDYDGNIKTVSDNLSTSSVIISGLNDPSAIAVLSTDSVSLPLNLVVNSGLTVLEGGPGAISDSVLSVTDGDTADADLVYTVTTAPINGRLLDSTSSTRSSFTQDDISSGEITYQHFGGENTVDSFTFDVTDGVNTLSSNVFSIAVTPQNDVPVALPEAYTLSEGATIQQNLAFNDSDAENRLDLDGIALTVLPVNGSVILNGDGTIDYSHDGSETTSDTFRYTIDDLDGATSNSVAVSLTITLSNDSPVANIESFAVDEGSVNTLDLAANDTDEENRLDVDSILTSGGPSHGSIVVNGDGTVDYMHDGSETTVDSFSYTINDLDGATSNLVTVGLTITPRNDAPVAVVESYTVDEGSITTLDLSANDTDAENRLDVNSIVISGGPSHGSVVVNGDGTVDYTHDGSETTADSFSYTINDLDGATSNLVTVGLTITPQNDAPVAVVESYTVNEGSITTLDLSANDTDAENRLDVNSIVISGGPSHGSVVVNGDGTVDYTHDGSETTADSFSYTINDLDGATSNLVTVGLTITPQNDAPVAVVESFTVDEGSVTALDLAANDTDAENRLDVNSIVISGGPSHGSIVVNGDGTIDYTHDGSETTADSFSYTINDLDGATSNLVAVGLTITPQNDAPVAVVESYTVDEGSVATLDLSVNDTDAENRLDVNSIVVSGGPSHGSIVVNGDGTVDYTHDGSETTADSFSYTINDLDGATSNLVTVGITITPQNDTPVAVVESYTVDEGAITTLDLSANDTDAENRLDVDSIVISGGPMHGAISINGDGTVDYTHDGSETTADSFNYTIKDLDSATSNLVTVGLTITPQNDAPVAFTDSFTVAEGSITNFALMANDADAENQLDLTSIEITNDPPNGSLVVNGDGSVDYAHDGSETTADSFSYTVRDLDGAISNIVTVGIVVTPQNDAPVAVIDSFVVTEGSTTMLSLAANDLDAENRLDLTSLVIINGPVNGSIVVNSDGTVEYEHDHSETTTDSFIYSIRDLDGTTSNSVVVNLSVVPQNDAPVASPEAYVVDEGSTSTLVLIGNDSDAENQLDPASIEVTELPSNGLVAINADGSVDYAHDGTETTIDQFRYTIRDQDGATSNEVLVSLSITPQNDLPVAVFESFTVDEGSTTTLDLASNDTDAESQLDVDSIVISGGPANGSIAINGDGTVGYTHNGTETTADSFNYSIKDLDGATSNTVTVSLAVTPRNDIPVAVVESFAVNEGGTSTFDLAANDIDAENRLDLSGLVITSNPPNGAVLVNGDGTVDYTHDGSETIADSFGYSIQDLDGAVSNVVTISVAINPQNDLPHATEDSFMVNEGASAILDVAANDSDIEGRLDTSGILFHSAALHGTIRANGDGTVLYTHDSTETTSDTFTYTISDLDGGVSSVVPVSIAVTPQNDAPVAVADDYQMVEGATVVLDLAANDTDAERRLDLSSIRVTSDPVSGIVDINDDGTVRYSHNGTEVTSDAFSYTINDQEGLTSAPVTVDLNIQRVNDAPIAVADSYTVKEGSSSVFSVLDNDSDTDDAIGTASLLITSQPMHGEAIVRTDGSIAYQHDGSEARFDQFNYVLIDSSGATSDSAAVEITVQPVNDPPLLVIPLTPSLIANSYFDTFTLDENTFVDPDKDDLIYSATQANGEELPGWLLFDPDTLIFRIDPNQAFGTEVSVVVVAQDGAEKVVSPAFTITVAPQVAAAESFLASEVAFPEQLARTEVQIEPLTRVVAENTDEEFTTKPEFSFDNKARGSKLTEATIKVDSMEEPRTEIVFSKEKESRKTAKRVVELEPVVENNPLRDLYRFDEEHYRGLFRGLIDAMDGVRQGFDDDRAFKTGLLASSAAVTSSLAVGYALWLIRGGALLFSFMASMPVWRFMDPFPILGQSENADDDDAESLESIVREKRVSRPQPDDSLADTPTPDDLKTSGQNDLRNTRRA